MTNTTPRRPALTAAMIRALHRYFAMNLDIDAPARFSRVQAPTIRALMRHGWIVASSLAFAGAVLTDDALDYLARRGDDDMVPGVRRFAGEQLRRDQLHAVAIAFRNEHGKAASTTYSEAFAAQRALDAAAAAEATSEPCPFTFAYGAPCRLPAGHHLAHLPVRNATDDPRYRRLVEQAADTSAARTAVDRGDDLRDYDEEAAAAAELAAEGESELAYERCLDTLDSLDDVLRLLNAGGRRLVDDTDVFTAEYTSVMTARRQLLTALAPELDAYGVLTYAAERGMSTRAAVEALRFGRADLVERVASAFDVPRELIEPTRPHDRWGADERWTYTGTPGLFRIGDERAPQVHALAVPDRPGRFTVSMLGRDIDVLERAPDGEWRPVGGGRA